MLILMNSIFLLMFIQCPTEMKMFNVIVYRHSVKKSHSKLARELRQIFASEYNVSAILKVPSSQNPLVLICFEMWTDFHWKSLKIIHCI